MRDAQAAQLRALPAVDRVLQVPAVALLLERYRPEPVVALLRGILEGHRRTIREGASAPSIDQLVGELLAGARAWDHGVLPVINASGVILHTNLGRAPLSPDAVSAMQQAAAYGALELDLDSGERNSRQDILSPLIAALTGTESALVTVNNAAAMLVTLTALTRSKEVIVSRGHSVEIGGGFRIPAILRQSGARLIDVGTTNRTRIRDYAEAIGPRTGGLLHVHTSNFRLVGFTEETPLAELAILASDHGIPLIVDNGSGALLDTARFGLAHEPTPIEALDAGADIVAFSGDKLLGGPQSGIIAGRRRYVDRIAVHPLMRALRPDKVAVAALAATLRAYLTGSAVETLPVWRMIAQTPSTLAQRAQHWQAAAVANDLPVDTRPGESTIGGGSLPGETLPTTLIVLPAGISAAALRAADPPIIARTRANRTLLDLRTVPADLEEPLLQVILRVREMSRSA